MEYLRSEQYYIDLYDLHTIEECLQSHKSAIKSRPQKPKGSKVKAIRIVTDLFTYYIKGERYRKKPEIIREWMSRDKEKDDRVENAITPQNVYCDSCSSKMDMTMKHLSSDDTRVMFWFECPNKCKKRKAVFDNGEGFKADSPLCPRCSERLNEKLERKGEKLITHIACPNCNYKNEEVIDFERDRKEWAEKERKDRELLKKYRWQFCLNEKEGQEYLAHIESMKRLHEIIEESEKKQKDPAYKKVQKLKKLKVTDLRKKLEKVLTKEKYLNLKLDKPQIERFVIVPFTLEDGNSKREEYDSRTNCRKIIKKVLESTNWRLMSEGVSYRLGYLSGNLKGYEQEEDLAELMRREAKDKPLINVANDPIY